MVSAIDVLIGVYIAHPFLTLLYMLNLFLSLIIAHRLVRYAIDLKGGTLSFALRYLSYAFTVLALVSIAKLLSAIPWFDWDLVSELAFTVFLLIVGYAVMHIAQTVSVYSQIKRR
ncbi:MAG: hypothetical protein ACP5H8_01395 [Candidatus Micrarchaeia archaeon]